MMPENEEKKQAGPQVASSPEISLPLRGKTILIVDDDPKIRQITQLMLKKEPYEVLEAGNATECMEKLCMHPVDLCLLDIDMPDMNGIALAKMIKNQPAYSDLPLIMVTARSDQHSVIMALKAGAADYVVKPVGKKILLQKIRKYVNKEADL